MKTSFPTTQPVPFLTPIEGAGAGREYSQSANHKTRQHLRRLLMIVAVGGAMTAAPIAVHAATKTLDDPQTTTQTVTTDTDSTVTVNTTDDFSVNTNAGDAVTISGAGNIIYDDDGNNNNLITTDAAGNGLTITSTGNNAGPPAQNGAVTVVSGGTISGGNSGINATNSGTGSTSVTATGTVTGITGRGIYAFNANTVGAGDVTVNANVVSSSNTGIFASNDGLGGTSISATGTVTSTDANGIFILQSNDDSLGDATVSAVDVTGGNYGINVIHSGTGDTSVSSTGTVTGNGADGILVSKSDGSSGNLTINAVNATGAVIGINAQHLGNGDTVVNATGTVIGTDSNGIFATNSDTSTGDVTVNANIVTGNFAGIQARNQGDGNVSVNATGAVTSNIADGIFVTNSSISMGDVTINAAVVTGNQLGINAINDGLGDISITATGTVTSQNDDGIRAANNNAGAGNITINAADVDAFDDGIGAENDGIGGIIVTSTGTVTAENGYGIYAYNNSSDSTGDVTVNANNVNADDYGIDAENYGTGSVNVTATGTVNARNDDGIYAYIDSFDATGNITINVVDVNANDDGIYAQSYGQGGISVTSTGTVTTLNDDGIDAQIENADATGNITINANNVNATDSGIDVDNEGLGSMFITATGTVTGQNDDGIYGANYNADGTGDITIKANNVSGNGESGHGIHAETDGLGNISVTATGNVSSSNDDAILALINNADSAGNLTVIANNVSGGDNGIVANNSGSGNTSVTATGTVSSAEGDGIFAQNDNVDGTGNVSVNANNVNGNRSGINVGNNGSGNTLVTARGTVVGTTVDGITATNGNADGTGSLTVSANNVTGAENGIDAESEGLGAVTVSSTGTVTGTTNNGISALVNNTNNTGGIVVNANNVNGDSIGINAQNAGLGASNVSATGNVTGTDIFGIIATNTNAANTGGIAVNANNVTGEVFGIFALNSGMGQNSVTATGTVTGSTQVGILAVNDNADNTGGIAVNANNVTGAEVGIVAQNEGLGATSVTSTGTVTGTNNDGIGVITGNAANTGGIAVNANNVAGGNDGIHVENNGLGGVSVSATGTVASAVDDGIEVLNTNPNNNAALTVNASNVTANDDGIFIRNQGTGNINIAATGTVTSATDEGIEAYNDNASGSGNIAINANNVTAFENGIYAENSGLGNTSVSATGTVTSANNYGIFALNSNAGAGNVAVSANNVTGAGDGIHVENNGLGNSSVSSTGTVIGNDTEGILIFNGNAANTGGQTVNANSVTGNGTGILAVNTGLGSTSVTATGNVVGVNTNGIFAVINNDDNTGTITVQANNVAANSFGIAVLNSGTGQTNIASSGNVAGSTQDGINAFISNPQNTGGIAVGANNASGAQNGIRITNLGLGATSIVSTGIVTGANSDGIFALNDNAAGTGAVTINANSVSGKLNGIHADNQGTGAIRVTTNGGVQGGENAVKIESLSTPNPISLTVNNGSILRNASNGTAANAISIQGVGGSAATITNNGLIRGNAQLGNENDTFNNNRIWNNAGGTSNFGGGNDTLNNNGAFLAATASGLSSTNINSIETVNNLGDLVLQNADARIGGTNAFVGDRLSFGNGGSGVFNANGGVLLVDTNIGAQTSDELAVDNLTGNLLVDVNVVDAADLGQPTTDDGVRIVNVRGTSNASVAVLVRPVTGGLFSYQLNRGANGSPSFFLQSAVRSEALAGSVLSVLGSRTALSTLSNVNNRQRDVGVLPDGQAAQRGVWGRIFGESSDYDSGNLGYDSNTYGAQAGVDLLASSDEKGNRKYAGLYVAYASSNGDVNSDGGKIGSLDLNATTLGAYYSWFSPRRWYFDAVAQYSLLGGTRVKTGGENISPDGSSYALSLEAGRKMPIGKKVASELQGQLIYQNTSLDDANLNDGTRLRLSNVNAVTGRLGVRLYGSEKPGSKFSPWLRANVWHTFDSDSTISSQGNSFSTPLGGTSGELELGFSKGNVGKGEWSAYGSIGYLFDLGGAEYSGFKGTVGLRKGF